MLVQPSKAVVAPIASDFACFTIDTDNWFADFERIWLLIALRTGSFNAGAISWNKSYVSLFEIQTNIGI